MSLKLLIATTNLHKVREFRALLKPIEGLDIFSLLDFPNYEPEEEIGNSFEEIVTKKVQHAAKHCHMLVIADDSGLVVPSLNGEPGIYSARYAGLGASDQDNRKKLLQNMRTLKDDQRHAYFVCSIALATPERLIKVVSAKCEGVILDEPRGGQGFGYDSLFLKHDYGKTFAEMDEALKNRISHRHKAFEKILPFIKDQAETYAAHH
jgi:XTP/dITP diphosphohydrolase